MMMPGVEHHVEALARDGYCIIANAFPQSWCDQASAALDRIEREQHQPRDWLWSEAGGALRDKISSSACG